MTGTAITAEHPRPAARTRPPLAYTAEEAAAIIGGNCKASWLKSQARAGKFRHEMIGGAYNFTQAHIDEIMRLCERPAAATAPAAAAPAPRRRAVGSQEPAAAPAPVAVLRARQPRRSLATTGSCDAAHIKEA